MPYFYLQLFAVVHGLDTNFAFYSLAILNVGSIPGRVIPNLLADRFGPFNVIIPFVAASAVLVFALFGIKTVADVVVFAILYGFVSGYYPYVLLLWPPWPRIRAKSEYVLALPFSPVHLVRSRVHQLMAPLLGLHIIGIRQSYSAGWQLSWA